MKKKIVVMGTPQFAVATLDALVEAEYDVRAVVTAPDRPAGRGKKMRTSAMSDRAQELNIPTLKPTNLKDEDFLRQLSELKAELFVVVAFRMLPEIVWSMPPLGTINLHGSLLPQYRGAAPINRAIMNGETETGVTTFFIRQKIDTGDIIDQEPIGIGHDETAGELHDRMMEIGARLVVQTVGRIFYGDVQARPQQVDETELKPAPKIHTEDRRIDWTVKAKEEHDHIRGLSPYPGAWTQLVQDEDRSDFKILKSEISNNDLRGAPGMLQTESGQLFVKCGLGTLRLLELQPPGKKRMKAEQFLRGARLSETHMFE